MTVIAAQHTLTIDLETIKLRRLLLKDSTVNAA